MGHAPPKERMLMLGWTPLPLLAGCLALAGAALIPSHAASACALGRETEPPWIAQARLDASGAPDKGWLAEASAIEARARQAMPAVAVVGDSITAGWLGEGRQTWADHFPAVGNLGLPGDTTQNLLFRIERAGLFDAIRPKLVVVLIGTNDVSRPDQLGCWSAAEVVRGIVAVAEAVRAKLPTARVLLATLPPNHATASGPEPLDTQVAAINARLPSPTVDYHAALARAEAAGGAAVIQPDGIHLTSRGYAVLQPELSAAIAAATEKDAAAHKGAL